MSGAALKPCPFCGSEARLLNDVADDDRQPRWWVTCADCLAASSSDYREDTVAAWNRRSAPASEREEPPAHEHPMELQWVCETCGHRAAREEK